ncbi:amino acid ABC transporter substrate-binding protein [Clostridium aestuarii]|uniref:Amino acid ABC transporter substrate-binding protein n=1 Tax=Clostridium aestuarii TaxID=338193 RepID=A0ABT4D2U7_9CLOT|nr:amino acid ABC transporter substrate-binding protein [Clostridium aestuarii]MCY6485561.1 amino acid ABC transporter substrate-binding protein [Clostridium aestuarii]
MLKRLSVVLLAIVVSMIGLIGCGTKQNTTENQKVIRVGSSGQYYPFTFVENDELQGFEIDVWNEIGKRIGYDVEFVTAKFSGLFGMLETDKLDTISNQISITQQRKEKYWFTTPYVYSGAQLVVKKGNDFIKGFEDLKGKKVGVSLGSNYEQMLRKFDKNNEINIITYDGGALEQDVTLGRIDAFLMDRVSSLALIKKTKLDLQLAGEPIAINENSFPFPKKEDNKELIENVNKAIEDMRADGTLKNISKKWFDIDITDKR